MAHKFRLIGITRFTSVVVIRENITTRIIILNGELIIVFKYGVGTFLLLIFFFIRLIFMVYLDMAMRKKFP